MNAKNDTLTTAEVVAWLAAVTFSTMPGGMTGSPHHKAIDAKLTNLNRDVQNGIVPLLTDDDYQACFAR